MTIDMNDPHDAYAAAGFEIFELLDQIRDRIEGTIPEDAGWPDVATGNHVAAKLREIATHLGLGEG